MVFVLDFGSAGDGGGFDREGCGGLFFLVDFGVVLLGAVACEEEEEAVAALGTMMACAMAW